MFQMNHCFRYLIFVREIAQLRQTVTRSAPYKRLRLLHFISVYAFMDTLRNI